MECLLHIIFILDDNQPKKEHMLLTLIIKLKEPFIEGGDGRIIIIVIVSIVVSNVS